ncbi:putative ATP-dependent RNA helicase DDX54 [Apostichopus japonicus]|uniref:Putative ATP-dependent RNA helicase DDX54 n=1 Tax=Stichopus japonicus TaxID=307972 RepID=A0A2G8JDL2_STIJA|nr:putative ATP-dependent RNA helicase DDX54 [Apostichopus japonicus]
MLSKRQKHGKYIEKARQTAEEREEEADKMPIRHISDLSANAEELFSKVAEPGKGSGRSGFTLTKSGKQLFNSSHKDEEFYIPHVAPDHRTEMGLGVNSFEQQASEDVLEMTQDESRLMHNNQQKTKWDRKRKRFVGSGGKEKMKKIKTESGTYISSSYKKNIYQDWLERSKEEGVNFDNLANEFTTKGEDAEDDYRRSGEF